MKCSSCGKQFDYEKYYGICPKCGVYHKPGSQNTQQPENPFEESAEFSYEESPEFSYEEAPPFSYEERQAYDMYVPERRRGMFRSTLILGIIVAAVIVAIIVVAVAGAAMTDYVEEMAQLDAKGRVLEKMEAKEIPLGEELGQLPVTIKQVEVIAEANQVEGFPQDERLLGVRVIRDARDEETDDYDYDDFLTNYYLEFDGTYRSNVVYYEFDPDYLHVLQGKKDYDGYGTYNDGYLYFFLPEDVQNCAIYVQTWDEDMEYIEECFRIPVTLDSNGNGGAPDEQ